VRFEGWEEWKDLPKIANCGSFIDVVLYTAQKLVTAEIGEITIEQEINRKWIVFLRGKINPSLPLIIFEVDPNFPDKVTRETYGTFRLWCDESIHKKTI